ncbi:MAG: DUF6391 domain-containing protein [Planctomycetota bacterium]
MKEKIYINNWEDKLARFIFRIILRGNFSYLVLATLVFIYGIGDKKQLGLIYAFLLPLLLIPIIFLNARFFIMLFKGFRIEEDVKANHSLEHGTIYFLRQNTPKRKIGGSAYENGFKLYGVREEKEIKESFLKFMEHFHRGESKTILSKGCGTNSEVFSGIAFITLISTFVIFACYSFSFKQTLIIILLNILIYLLLKYPLGRLYQKQITTSIKFKYASIKSIEKVKPTDFFEKSPIFFVHTIVN